MAAPSHAGRGRRSQEPSELLHKLVGFPPEDFISILAPLLERLMERNETLPLKELTSFHARSRPPITVASYLSRFLQYAPMANECYILMLIYLDRISQTNPAFCITPMNAHRMIVTGLVLAAKFSQDRYYTNTHYAKVGGLPAQELKALELEFLARIFYTLWADTDIIEAYWAQLLQHAQRNNLLSNRAKEFLQSQPPTITAAGPPRFVHPCATIQSQAATAHGGEPGDTATGIAAIHKKPRLDTGCPEQVMDQQQITDEAMRYELLRRQQERLRAMSGSAVSAQGGSASDQSAPLVTHSSVPALTTAGPYPYPSPQKFSQEQIASHSLPALPNQHSSPGGMPAGPNGPPGYQADGAHAKQTNVFRYPHRQASKSPLYAPYRTPSRSSPLALSARNSPLLCPGDAGAQSLEVPTSNLSPRSAGGDGAIRSRSASLESGENSGHNNPSPSCVSPCWGSSSATQSPALLTPV